MNQLSRWTTARQELRARRNARRALAQELGQYDSPSALIELSAILARHDDAATEDIRGIVDWTKAA